MLVLYQLLLLNVIFVIQHSNCPSSIQTQHITSLVFYTPHQHPYALPIALSASIKNWWQLWLYLTDSWLRCPSPYEAIQALFLLVLVFNVSINLLVFPLHPRGRTRGRVVLDGEDSMDGTEITESIGPQDTGKTLKFPFFIHYVHTGLVKIDIRMEPAHPGAECPKRVFFY